MTFKNIKTAEDLERERIESEAERVRSIRDSKLKELDNFVMNPLRWMEFTDLDKELLAQYRHKLKDVPEQEGFPWEVEWPEKPTVMEEL